MNYIQLIQFVVKKWLQECLIIFQCSIPSWAYVCMQKMDLQLRFNLLQIPLPKQNLEKNNFINYVLFTYAIVCTF